MAAEELRGLVSTTEAITAVRTAFANLSAGVGALPRRLVLDGGQTLIMAAQADYAADVVVKVVSLRPDNRSRGYPTLSALVLVLDRDTGQPCLVVDGSSVTAIRTGAASGVATDLLAEPDAEILAMIGAGGQSLDQVRAVCAVRPIRELRIFSRRGVGARVLAERLADEADHLSISISSSSRQATRGADIVCCATDASTPVIAADALGERVHINAIGSFRPDMREVPLEVLGRASSVVVDQIEAAKEEAGELIDATEAGVLSWNQVAELGDLILAPPSAVRGITVFKSVGIAIQDCAIAGLLRAQLEHSVDPQASAVR